MPDPADLPTPPFQPSPPPDTDPLPPASTATPTPSPLDYAPISQPPPPLPTSTILIRLLFIPMYFLTAIAGVASDRISIPVPKAILLTIGNLAIPLAISLTARTKLSRNYATFVWAIALLHVWILWFWNVR